MLVPGGFLLLLAVACGGDDDRGPGPDGGAGTDGIVLANDAEIPGGPDGGGGMTAGTGGVTGGTGGTGGTEPISGTGGAGTGGGNGGSGGETAVDGGSGTGDPIDGGAEPDAGKIPTDGSWLSICYSNNECNGDDLVCFGDGGGFPGFCTEDCRRDTDCQPIDGMEATGSPQDECRVVCEVVEDTNCPAGMECRQLGGGNSFACAYPLDVGTGAAGQWESCDVSHGDADCESGLVCYLPTWPPAIEGTGFCTEECETVMDCTQPADITISSVIACGPTAATGTRWCRLDCSVEGSTCPEGMACEDIVPNTQQQVLICRYPLE